MGKLNKLNRQEVKELRKKYDSYKYINDDEIIKCENVKRLLRRIKDEK